MLQLFMIWRQQSDRLEICAGISQQQKYLHVQMNVGMCGWLSVLYACVLQAQQHTLLLTLENPSHYHTQKTQTMA